MREKTFRRLERFGGNREMEVADGLRKWVAHSWARAVESGSCRIMVVRLDAMAVRALGNGAVLRD